MNRLRGTFQVAFFIVSLTCFLEACRGHPEQKNKHYEAPSSPREALSQLQALPSALPATSTSAPAVASSTLWPALDDHSLDHVPAPKSSVAVGLSSTRAQGRSKPPPVIPPELRGMPGPEPMTATSEHDRRANLVRAAVQGCVKGTRASGRIRVLLALTTKGKPGTVDVTVTGRFGKGISSCVRRAVSARTFPATNKRHQVDSFVVLVRRGRIL